MSTTSTLIINIGTIFVFFWAVLVTWTLKVLLTRMRRTQLLVACILDCAPSLKTAVFLKLQEIEEKKIPEERLENWI